jgi:hypothetical protein
MRAKEFIFEDTRSAREKFLDRVIGPESGGKLGIQNKRSGAQGLFQFMPDTWAGVVKKAKPGDPHYGMSFDQMRHNEKAQRAAANQISREYEASIRRNQMPDTPTSYYLLHGHGPKGVDIYKNPDKQLKDIYPEFVKNKEGKMVKNIVYRQNPNFDPNQRLSDFVGNTAAKMGDKLSDLYPGNTRLATKEPTKVKTTEPSYKDAFKNVGTTTVSRNEPSTFDKFKKKATDIGTNILGAVTGSTNAYAGDLPPEKKKLLQQPVNKDTSTAQPEKKDASPGQPDWMKLPPKTYGAGYDPSKVVYAYGPDGKPNKPKSGNNPNASDLI